MDLIFKTKLENSPFQAGEDRQNSTLKHSRDSSSSFRQEQIANEIRKPKRRDQYPSLDVITKHTEIKPRELESGPAPLVNNLLSASKAAEKEQSLIVTPREGMPLKHYDGIARLEVPHRAEAVKVRVHSLYFQE